MSRFIEKLKKVGESGPAPMGFGPASRRESQPGMLLMGLTSASALKKGQATPVDALVISYKKGESPLSEIKESLDSVIWGLWLEGDATSETIEEVKATGGDFVVFYPESMPAEVLQEEELGKIMSLGSAVVEETARGMDSLAIDAAVLKAPEDMLPLTVQKLIDMESSRSLVSKDVILFVPSALSSKELMAVRDLGVDALIVDVEKVKGSDLKDMRSAMDGLPRKKGRQERLGAVLPRGSMGFGSSQPRKEEEEEDGEEEDE